MIVGLCVTQSGTLQAYIAAASDMFYELSTLCPFDAAWRGRLDRRLEQMLSSTDVIVSLRTRRTLGSMSEYGKES